MRTYMFYLASYMSKNFNNARPLSAYFVTTEGVGSHYEGHEMHSPSYSSCMFFSTRVNT